jgi:uncharacterized protein
MRIFIGASLIFLVAGSVHAQNPAATATAPAPAPAVESKIDPAKEADIRRLLDATGTVNVMQQLLNNMDHSLRPMMANSLPPGDYRDKLIDLFFQKFRSKLDMKRLLDMAVVRYDQSFSDEEIKGLIGFYETPLGKKIATALPKISVQLEQDGQSMGQQIGRDSMVEVLTEHPELAQALQEASQKAALARQ